jgi:carotenoid 1,2-hydratase
LRGERAPGRGGADGDLERGEGGGGARRRFPFDGAPADGGYAWLYIDVLGDDGRSALTVILFEGAVFSPRYFAARRSAAHAGQPAPPARHYPAVNIALHSSARQAWVMSEYPASTDTEVRDPDAPLSIGKSTARWTEAGLTLTLDERTAILGARVRGEVTITATCAPGPRLTLAEPGHAWQPLIPQGRAVVALDGARFEGRAYVDANRGDGPLEAAFRRWRWMRVDHPEGPRLVYAGERRDGTAFSHAFALDFAGTATPWDVREATLSTTPWGVRRVADLPPHAESLRVTTLLDSPFYARTRLDWRETPAGLPASNRAAAMHESVDLDRFGAGWVRFLLPFKMRQERA